MNREKREIQTAPRPELDVNIDTLFGTENRKKREVGQYDYNQRSKYTPVKTPMVS